MSMSPNMGAATGANLGARTGSQKSPNVQWGKSSGGYKSGQMSNFTPEMMQQFQQMFGHLGPDSYLGRLAAGDQSMFEEMEAPAWKQFQGVQGNIASRFSQAGGLKSSGFKNSMSELGSDFAQKLQSQRMDIRNQAIKDLMSMSSNLLDKRPYENFLMEKQPGFLEKVFGAIGGAGLSGLSGGLSGYLGNLGKRNINNPNKNNPTG